MHNIASGNTVTYRLIVVRRRASEILVADEKGFRVLPRVKIDLGERVARELAFEAKTLLGMDTYCVFLPTRTAGTGEAAPACAVLEVVGEPSMAPPGTRWILRADAEAASSNDAQALREALREWDQTIAHRSAGPFIEPGWLDEVRAWVEERVRPMGLALSGGFRQLNAGASFSLVRFETDREAVWFKATGAPNRHELPLTVCLARLFPGCVPEVLAVHRDWNAWLTLEAHGKPLGAAEDVSAWQQAARTLAELEISSIDHAQTLKSEGAKDMTLRKLAPSIRPFLRSMGDCMKVQQKTSPSPLGVPALATVAESLSEACQLLDRLHLPETLGHMDLNPANILVSSRGSTFLDWAEGCVMHPLLSFPYLREQASRSRIAASLSGDSLASAYLGPWASFYSVEELSQAQPWARLVAVFACAVASDSWRSLDPAERPLLAAYYRSLTRRMYREAMRLSRRSTACLG